MTPSLKTLPSCRGRCDPWRTAVAAGFTVVEMLVAVAAVTLIAVGIAQIFRATGETVRVGKRVSNLSTYAQTIERQMRLDIASMTRQGFLLIHHQYVDADQDGQFTLVGDAVPLSASDRFARPRRIDEMMFFAQGEFESLREPIHPDRSPRSSQARVYFGHGLGRNPADPQYTLEINLDDDNSTATGFGLAGANRYAADWTLARQVTLLIPPGSIAQDPLNPPVTNPTLAQQPDNAIQIGMQPAAFSVFRVINLNEPFGAALPPSSRLVRAGPPVRPAFACGVVDIASLDLEWIRSVVLDAQQISSITIPYTLIGTSGPSFTIDLAPQDPNSTTQRMQSWMRQALPADPNNGRRIRVEPTPPDYLGVLDDGVPHAHEYQRTDQVMLSSFNFVPHCTEFIVEWSFGKIYPPASARAGELIWHGLPRRIDMNGDGVPDPPDLAAPYQGTTGFNGDQYVQTYQKLDGTTGQRVVSPWVVQPPVLGAGPVPLSMYSYFGYVDPTFAPAANDPPSVPWAWPSLIRVTMSLVDPADPQREQTFQFVFEVPKPPDERGF